MNSLLSYKYYDTPMGHDIFMKTFAMVKYAGTSGFVLASYDVLMFSHPKGIANIAGRYMWYVGPFVGMASAFSVGANTAANIRGKDDLFNQFLGGVAAGSVYGAWQRSITTGIPMAIFLGIVGIVAKTARDNNHTILFRDLPKCQTNSAWSANRDFTMAKDFPEYKQAQIKQ